MQLSKDQISQFEEFISKIPVSKVRSDIERLWDGIKKDGYRVRFDQLDNLKDFAIHLVNTDLQTFVPAFIHWVMNGEQTEIDETGTPKKAKANLGEGVADTQKDVKVKDKNIEDNSVSIHDDKENKAASKPTEKKKEESKELEKEAKAGDLKRTPSSMKDVAHKKRNIKTKKNASNRK